MSEVMLNGKSGAGGRVTKIDNTTEEFQNRSICQKLISYGTTLAIFETLLRQKEFRQMADKQVALGNLESSEKIKSVLKSLLEEVNDGKAGELFKKLEELEKGLEDMGRQKLKTDLQWIFGAVIKGYVAKEIGNFTSYLRAAEAELRIPMAREGREEKEQEIIGYKKVLDALGRALLELKPDVPFERKYAIFERVLKILTEPVNEGFRNIPKKLEDRIEGGSVVIVSERKN